VQVRSIRKQSHTETQKAYITTFEEADDVAKAMPVNRSTKAIPNIKACFLFIVTLKSLDTVCYIVANFIK